MPLYEFKCLTCQEFFEILVMNSADTVALTCPRCKSGEIERVPSAASYTMGGRSGRSGGASTQTRTCSGGSCTTYDIPGPS